MAKRPTKRTEPEPDPDLEDEEIELEETARKPAPRASGKSKGKSSEKNDVPARKSKDSGKRKSARSASKDDEGDDPEMNSSARRRRAAPAAKKKDNSLVMIISAVSATVLICLIIVVFNKKRVAPPGRNEQSEYDKFKSTRDEGMAAFSAFNKAQKDGNAALALQKGHEAHDKLTSAMDQINAILEHHQKKDGSGTEADYEGYEAEQGQMAQIMVDIEKRMEIGR